MQVMDGSSGLAALIEAVKESRQCRDQDIADHATRRGYPLTRPSVQAARTRPLQRIDRSSVLTWSAALGVSRQVVLRAMMVSIGWEDPGPRSDVEELEHLIARVVPDPGARAAVWGALSAVAVEGVGRDGDAAPMTEAGETPANEEPDVWSLAAGTARPGERPAPGDEEDVEPA